MSILGIYLFIAHCSLVAMVFHNEVDLERLKKSTAPIVNSSSTHQGFVMCSSNKHHMIAGTMRMVYMVRRTMNSTLPFAIFHCSEISYENQRLLQMMDSALTVHNLCERDPVLDKLSLPAARDRLRGFLCKVAALVKSPFEETFVVDADVVWFKKPDILFESKQFRETGSLFFRDRVLVGKENIHDIKKQFETYGVLINNDTARKQFYLNGISYFWLHFAEENKNRLFPYVNQYQDSSLWFSTRKLMAALSIF